MAMCEPIAGTNKYVNRTAAELDAHCDAMMQRRAFDVFDVCISDETRIPDDHVIEHDICVIYPSAKRLNCCCCLLGTAQKFYLHSLGVTTCGNFDIIPGTGAGILHLD